MAYETNLESNHWDNDDQVMKGLTEDTNVKELEGSQDTNIQAFDSSNNSNYVYKIRVSKG
jgi:hypothetical protein